MRKGQTPQFWIEDGEVIGFNLSTDFVAEHETGITEIRELLGIADPYSTHLVGIKRRMMTKIPMPQVVDPECSYLNPKALFFQETSLMAKEPRAILMLTHYQPTLLKNNSELGRCELQLQDSNIKDIAAAWDSKSFGIHVRGKYNVNYLRELYIKMLEKDAMVFLGKATPYNPFENSGLQIFIESRIPRECKDIMRENDLDLMKFRTAAKAG